jgi:hypothetical protein
MDRIRSLQALDLKSLSGLILPQIPQAQKIILISPVSLCYIYMDFMIYLNQFIVPGAVLARMNGLL